MQRMLVTFALVLAANLVCQQSAHPVVYRWVDDQGVVHFAEQAPEGVNATAVNVRPNTVSSIPAPPVPDEQSSDDPAATAQDPAEALSYAETRRRDRAESRRQRAEEASRNQENCDKVRSQFETIESRPSVRVTDEDGNQRRLLDEEREAALSQASAYLSENCNP